MSESNNNPPVLIQKKSVPQLGAMGFEFSRRGNKYTGIVVHTEAGFFAFLNECRHLPVTLDLRDDDFLSADRKHLQCQMHGAIYEKETGLCVGGPCVGKSLRRFSVSDEGKQLLVEIPEDFPDDSAK